MLGEGPLRDSCIAYAAAHGLGDRVEFPGFVADPAPWFSDSKLFLLSSDYEELPAVLFEAAVAGCGLVSTDASPAIVDLLKNGAGRLVPTGDVDAFRSAVAEALDDDSHSPAIPDWVRGYSVSLGVNSHAEALGLL
jgi:glycosyltransferase involved in cell wall biosynthesis